jgi:hypothetical protein
MPDPTLEIVKRLPIDTEWDKVIANVPIFRPHVMLVKEKDGKQYQKTVQFDSVAPDLSQYIADGWEIAYTITPDRLQDIAFQMARSEQSGGPAVIRVGHTKLPAAKVPQEEQPPIRGFHRNPRYGTFGPANTPAVITDHCIEKGHGSAVEGFGWRSAEFYPATNEITGTSLLRTDPELDLGYVAMSKERGRLFHYAMEMEPHPEPHQPPAGHESRPPQTGLHPPGLTGQPDAHAPPPEFVEHAHRYMDQHLGAHIDKQMPHLRKMHEEYAARCAPQQYGGGTMGGGGGAMGGAPAPTSMTPPGPYTAHPTPPPPQPQRYQAMNEAEKKEFDELKQKVTALSMQRDTDQTEIKNLRGTVTTLTEGRSNDAKQYARNESEAIVQREMDDGYHKDANADEIVALVNEFAALPTSEDRKKRDVYVRKHYTRTESPIHLSKQGFDPRIDRGPMQPVQLALSEEDQEAVQHYMSLHENDDKYRMDADSSQLADDAAKAVLEAKQKRRAG